MDVSSPQEYCCERSLADLHIFVVTHVSSSYFFFSLLTNQQHSMAFED